MSNIILIEVLIFLTAAVIAVPVAKSLGLGSVLGYLIAGILISPLLQYLDSDTDDFQHFAEFGVVMMLFLVGLELEPHKLWKMRHRLMGLGGLQIGGTVLLFALCLVLIGFEWPTAIAIGLILAPSSTAIVLQTLEEKSLMKTDGGRASFSVLLFQDIAIIPILAILPLLAMPELALETRNLEQSQHHSVLRSLPAWQKAVLTLAAIGAIYLVGTYLTRPVFRFIAKAGMREIFTAAALLIVVSTAVLMSLVGLSAALGTFLAGVILATSEYRHELEADIAPFKGLLLGLFFITVGAGIDFGVFASMPLLIISATIGILILKALVLWIVASLFKIKGQHKWLMVLGLAEAGEFGFVLLSLAGATSVLPPETVKILSLVVALTMVLTPLLFIAFDKLVVDKRLEDEKREADEIDEEGEVIIAGQGRFGQVVNRLLLSQGIKSVVLDHESTQIERLRPFGIKAFFGDPTRVDLLHAAGIMTAKALVVAIDQPDQAIKLVEIARRARPDIHIIARANDRFSVYALYKAGANDIVREMFDSSVRAGRYTLQALGKPEALALRIANRFVDHERGALAKLAPLWDPEIPVTANPDYMALARQLNTDIGQAMEGLDVELDDPEVETTDDAEGAPREPSSR